MLTTVTGKNMVSIPRAVAEQYGIEPGWKLDWLPGEEPDVLVVHLVPGRGTRAQRLRGAGKELEGAADAVTDLVVEREADER